MNWSNWCAAALLFGGTLAADAAVELTKHGALAADGCEFEVTLFNKSWNGLSQSRSQFRMIKDGRREGTGSAELQFSGLPELPPGTLSVTLEGDAAKSLRYAADVRFREPAELNTVALTMANPMLWYLMGATEGMRKEPVSLDEIRTMGSGRLCAALLHASQCGRNRYDPSAGYRRRNPDHDNRGRRNPLAACNHKKDFGNRLFVCANLYRASSGKPGRA